jgi:hypothetical protein
LKGFKHVIIILIKSLIDKRDPLAYTANLRMNLISEVYNKYRFSVDECSHKGYLEYIQNNELPMLTKEEKADFFETMCRIT